MNRSITQTISAAGAGLVVLLALTAPAAQATSEREITPDMVRQVGAPAKPDNGNLQVQPGMRADTCAKDDKGPRHKENKGKRAITKRSNNTADVLAARLQAQRPHKGECVQH